MEENVKPKKVKVVETPKVKTTEDKIIELADSGFNVNQIASMLALHSHIVKQVIDEANANL